MRERTRDRDVYDQIVSGQKAERQRSWTGQVVVRGKGNPWILDRQGLVRHYLTPSRYTGEPVDTALDGWIVFVQEVGKHSGKHRHQGGLVIYVLEGEGHSIVDGERLEWEPGDLMLLPIKPGGVEHQHFNKDESKPVKWIAFIHTAVYEWGASEMVQIEQHPEFKARAAAPRRRR
jgi:quercetin dioxygenase-like cupin family protein